MYASGNAVLYTLSRLIKYRFMALGNLYTGLHPGHNQLLTPRPQFGKLSLKA